MALIKQLINGNSSHFRLHHSGCDDPGGVRPIYRVMTLLEMTPWHLTSLDALGAMREVFGQILRWCFDRHMQ